MLDAQTHHAADILPPASRAYDRRRIEADDHLHAAHTVELWRAPLHLGFSFGLFLATRALRVR